MAKIKTTLNNATFKVLMVTSGEWFALSSPHASIEAHTFNIYTRIARCKLN